MVTCGSITPPLKNAGAAIMIVLGREDGGSRAYAIKYRLTWRKKNGQQMTHYIIRGGRFQKACMTCLKMVSLSPGMTAGLMGNRYLKD